MIGNIKNILNGEMKRRPMIWRGEIKRRARIVIIIMKMTACTILGCLFPTTWWECNKENIISITLKKVFRKNPPK